MCLSHHNILTRINYAAVVNWNWLIECCVSPLSLQRLQLNISEILTCHMKVHWGSGVDCITFFYKIFYDLTCEPVWLVSIKKNQMAIFARAKCHVHFLHSSDRGAQFPFLVDKKITIQWLMAFSFHVHNFFLSIFLLFLFIL